MNGHFVIWMQLLIAHNQIAIDRGGMGMSNEDERRRQEGRTEDPSEELPHQFYNFARISFYKAQSH